MNRKTENYIKLVDKLKSEYLTLGIKCSELRMKSRDFERRRGIFNYSENDKLLKEARTKELATEIKLAALMIAALHKSKKVSTATKLKGFTDNQTYAYAIKRSIIEKHQSLYEQSKINREISFRQWEIIPGTKNPNYLYSIYRKDAEHVIDILVRNIERDISRGAVKRINNEGTVRDIDRQLAEKNRKEGRRMY